MNSGNSPNDEFRVAQKLALKQRLRECLLKSPGEIDVEVLRNHPPEKLKKRTAIVRSINDSSYPEVDESPGISSWFKLEIWDFYHNGIEFVGSVEPAFVDSENRWKICNDETEMAGFTQMNVLKLLQIPYEKIVDVDLSGDEYYPYPHFYCRFDNAGEPYEDKRFVLAKGYPWPLDPDLRIYMPEERKEEKSQFHVGNGELEGDIEFSGSNYGSGLKGRVFQAKQKIFDRPVAVKFIKEDFGGDAVAQGKRLAKLKSHPNVVSVYFIARLENPIDGSVSNALVMEWLEGRKLEELLGRNISIADAEKLCRGIVAGIKHFHDSGVAHSDLHEGNVLVTSDFIPKIIDADEERYATLLRLSNNSIDKAIKEDLRYCGDLVFKICRDSELDYQSVVDIQSKLRVTDSLDDVDDILNTLFGNPKVPQQATIASAVQVDLETIRNEFKERVFGQKFWNVEQTGPQILISVLPESEFTISFDKLNEHRPDPVTRSGGWGFRNRANVVAAINIKRDKVVSSVAESDINGRTLAVDRFIFDPVFHPYDEMRFPVNFFAGSLVKSIRGYVERIKDLGYSGKVSIAVSLINVLGCVFPENGFGSRNIVLDIEKIEPKHVSIELPTEFDNLEVAGWLKPIFDHIWREFELPKCDLYTANGTFTSRIL